MPSIDGIVERNYHGIVDEECTARVIAYLAGNPRLGRKNAEFAKQITKVAWRIYKEHPELISGFADRLYAYAADGAEQVRTGKYRIFNKKQLNTLEPHLHGYAGYFAAVKYEATQNPPWALRAYSGYAKAVDMTKDSEPQYAAKIAVDAAHMARKIHERTGSELYANRWCSALQFSAETAESFDFSFAANIWQELGDALKTLAQKKDDPQLYERACTAYQRALSYFDRRKRAIDETGKRPRTARRLRELVEKTSNEFERYEE